MGDEDPGGLARVAAPADDDRFAAKLRGFGPVGVLAIIVITLVGPIFEPVGGILVLLWARRSRTPWRDLGFVRPKSWIATIALAVVGGAVFKIVMKAIVMPLFGAPPINPAFHYLAGNRSALPGIFFAVTVGAGFTEETVFRGFLFQRFGKLLGESRGAKTAIVAGTSAYFGLIHWPVQGLPGVEQAVITGLVFGTIFAATRRIWPLIFAHAAFDVTAVLMIYWDLETKFAHLVFR